MSTLSFETSLWSFWKILYSFVDRSLRQAVPDHLQRFLEFGGYFFMRHPVRFRADILLVYKILFGMMHANSNELFTLRNQRHLLVIKRYKQATQF